MDRRARDVGSNLASGNLGMGTGGSETRPYGSAIHSFAKQ
jgi:hypothetical protein